MGGGTRDDVIVKVALPNVVHRCMLMRKEECKGGVGRWGWGGVGGGGIRFKLQALVYDILPPTSSFLWMKVPESDARGVDHIAQTCEVTR